MYRTAEALRDAMIALGVACDGGKDSLSMAAPAGDEVVMAPGNLVISAYVGCPDITRVVTPDLKAPGSYLLLVDISKVRFVRRRRRRVRARGMPGTGGCGVGFGVTTVGSQWPRWHAHPHLHWCRVSHACTSAQQHACMG